MGRPLPENSGRALDNSYSTALAADVSDLTEVVARLSAHDVAFVASGGALAVAQLAATLHERTTGHAARAMTPLQLTWLTVRQTPAVCLISSSGRHPDAVMSARVALARGAPMVAAITQRSKASLPVALRDPRIRVATLRQTVQREGFLASTSVIQVATALVRSYDPACVLPPFLPAAASAQVESLRELTLLLATPDLLPVATDLEARLSETGISAAQVTDYRNFAHGRHLGFYRSLPRTTVLALRSKEWYRLTDSILAELPPESAVMEFATEFEWPVSVLDLLMASIVLIDSQARAIGLNLRRPGVPKFGRRLYNQRSAALIPPSSYGPVERKLAAAGNVANIAELRDRYLRAFAYWTSKLATYSFNGIVLDYDGTVCGTEDRFSLPSEPIRAELVRLLDQGARIGFASGRGDSLHRDLREWLPQRSWEHVVLTLYNGGLTLRLDEEWPSHPEPDPAPVLAEAAKRLNELLGASNLAIRVNHWQVSARLSRVAAIDLTAVTSSIEDLLVRAPRVRLKVVTSAHSIDLVPLASSKSNVLAGLRAVGMKGYVAVGDQGQRGGNDHELLSATPNSLSVDQCSTDPSRCWNLDRWGLSGPPLLLQYLRAIENRGGTLRYKIAQ